MSVYLESKSGGREISSVGYANACELARRFGWDYSGVYTPKPGSRRGFSLGHGVVFGDGPFKDEDDDDTPPWMMTAECGASFAEALEAALTILNVWDPSVEECIATRVHVGLVTFSMEPDYSTISTRELMCAFGHQRDLLEGLIAVGRGGEVGIY